MLSENGFERDKSIKCTQRAVPRDEPAYMGMSFIGGNCPKSPRRIMEQPPNEII